MVSLRPRQGFQRFAVLKRQGAIAPNGRPLQADFLPAGELIGMLALASQGELQQWRPDSTFRQETHNTMFKIIKSGRNNGICPGDVLTLGNRKFTVKGIHNPGGLHHFTTYFAEEREDLQ